MRPIATSEYTSLAEAVEPGRFSLFTGTTGVPGQLDAHAGAGHLYGILVAASNSSENPPTLGGIRPRPGQPVYAVNRIRYDQGHGASPEPHSNVDRSLLFLDEHERAFRLTFSEHPAHYRRLSSDTGLEAVLANHGIPHRPSGDLSELSTAAGWQNFSTSFPPSRAER